VGEESQAKIKAGEVVIYVDHERLLIKVCCRLYTGEPADHQAYDEDGLEEDIAMEYAHMIDLKEVDGQGSGSERNVVYSPLLG